MPTPPLVSPLVVRLSLDDRNKLALMAEHAKTTRSEIIRRLIRIAQVTPPVTVPTYGVALG